MHLYALDVRVRDARVLTDLEAVTAILYAAAASGDATVVGEAFHVFSNDAVTGVLVLAQSHLSIHTWPEYSLANVDLLSYGDLDGGAVLRVVAERLDAVHTHVTSLPRAFG
jgi:S-adenosylmethionine decarboxylase